MAQTLETLRIEIETQLSDLRRDMEKARSVTRKSSRQISGSMDKIKKSSARAAAGFRKFRGAIAIAAGAGGLALMGKRALELADSLDKTSLKLDVNVETLQELQFASKLAGVQTTALNVGLQRFLRRVAEARNGTGVLGKEVVRLGLALNHTDGTAREGTEIFKDYLEIINKTESGQERLRLAFQAFDTEGVALVNVANLGARELERLAKQARDLGIVLDKQAIARLVETKDKISILSDQINVNLAQALSDILPLFDSMAGAVATVTSGISRFFEVFHFAEARSEITKLTRELFDLDNQIRILQERRPGMNIGLNLPPLEELQERRRELLARKAAIREEQSAKREAEARVRTRRAVTGAPSAVGLSKDEVQETKDLLAQINMEFLSATDQRIEIAKLERDERIAALKAVKATSEELAKAQTQIERIFTIERDEIRNEAIEKEKEAQLERKEAFDDVLEGMSESFSRAFADMLLSGEFTFQSLARSFARDFIAKAINDLAKAGLTALVTSAGGAEGGFGKALTRIFGSGKAHGGDVGAGRPFLVGERGPEIFRPNKSGTIVPSGGVAGGGGQVIVNINNSGTPMRVTNVREQKRDMLRLIEVSVDNQIDRSIRGGKGRRAIQQTFRVTPRGTVS